MNLYAALQKGYMHSNEAFTLFLLFLRFFFSHVTLLAKMHYADLTLLCVDSDLCHLLTTSAWKKSVESIARSVYSTLLAKIMGDASWSSDERRKHCCSATSLTGIQGHSSAFPCFPTFFPLSLIIRSRSDQGHPPAKRKYIRYGQESDNICMKEA